NSSRTSGGAFSCVSVLIISTGVCTLAQSKTMHVGSQYVQVTISSSVTTGKKRSRESGPVSWTALGVPAMLFVRSLACSSCIHGCSSIFRYTIVSILLLLHDLHRLLLVYFEQMHLSC